MSSEDPRIEVQEALGDFLDEGRIITGWFVVMEVADSKGVTLMHRAGGGAEGNEPPTLWAALGMLRAATIMAERQLPAVTRDADEPT